MCGWEGAIDGTHTSLDILLKNDCNNKHDFLFVKRQLEIYFNGFLNNIVLGNACHLSKSTFKMYRNFTVCVHVRNLHLGANLPPGANKFAPPRRQEQICTRGQICTRVQILKTPFTWPKIHPGCKFAPRVQICTRVQIAHMNEA